MHYTLGQAAKASGKSKPTISRAIQSGKLSAQRQENGSYLIDPAELVRVYPTVTDNGNETGDMERSETVTESKSLQAIVDVMREERERERRQLQDTIDDLRDRLTQEASERREAQTRLTALLTHQPAPQSGATEPSGKRGVFGLFGGKPKK